mmetsp:Transcript_13534/g.29421  ORF Transcript_13534/g.29421 Transcript_13534/m.29421 type:complete len:309 (+) Transcript_13534:92-1018(+)
MTVSPPTDLKADVGSDSRRELASESLPSVETLFVWDFDWTIVNCNSDEYVPSAFIGDAATDQRLRHMIETHGPEKWHECVSSLVNACMDESKCSKDDICEAAASMPYLVDVRGSLKDVADDMKCGQAIISDGNDDFIGAFVKKNEMGHYFSHGIETNVGNYTTIETGQQFSVVYQSSKYGGHSCNKCPPNLCKSQVLLDILRRTETNKRPRIVYVGDGSNDACPALHVLDEGDVLLARDGKRISNPNSKSGSQPDEENADELTGGKFPILSVIEKCQKEEGLVPKCRMCAWNSGKELRSLVQNILEEF